MSLVCEKFRSWLCSSVLKAKNSPTLLPSRRTTEKQNVLEFMSYDSFLFDVQNFDDELSWLSLLTLWIDPLYLPHDRILHLTMKRKAEQVEWMQRAQCLMRNSKIVFTQVQKS